MWAFLGEHSGCGGGQGVELEEFEVSEVGGVGDELDSEAVVGEEFDVLAGVVLGF